MTSFPSYSDHHDFLAGQDEETELQVGNRALTVYIYLNDGTQFQGGETVFTHLDVTVSPQVGTAIVWANVLNEQPTEKDWRTNHEARPVGAGTKFGANVWMRNRPFRSAWQEFTCEDDDDDVDAPEDIPARKDDLLEEDNEADAVKAEL